MVGPRFGARSLLVLLFLISLVLPTGCTTGSGSHDVDVAASDSSSTSETLAEVPPTEDAAPDVAVDIRPDDLRDFGGIYGSPEVFKGLTERRTLENPEVVIKVPEGPGVKVGVYHGSFGATALIGAIGKRQDFNAFSLPRLDEGALAKSDVVVISKTAATVNFKHAAKRLRAWVEEGGRLLLCFDAVGYRAHPAIFPELGQGYTNPKRDVVTVSADHPVTNGFEKGDEFVHAYVDHVEMTKGERGKVIVVDEKRKPVVIVGAIGKGRVVLNGMITGYASVKRGEYAGLAKEPEEGELKLLHNMIQWLGEE